MYKNIVFNAICAEADGHRGNPEAVAHQLFPVIGCLLNKWV